MRISFKHRNDNRTSRHLWKKQEKKRKTFPGTEWKGFNAPPPIPTTEPAVKFPYNPDFC